MNLVLWRHAEAEDSYPDLARALTPRGRRQAERVGAWLTQHLPGPRRLICSPALRTRQTAEALGRPDLVDPRLAPDADMGGVLAAIGWPHAAAGHDGSLVVVGHQPTMGMLAALLLGGREQAWAFRKGAAWWFSTRDREDSSPVVLRMVVDPDILRH